MRPIPAPAESEQQVQGRVQALIDAIMSGANLDSHAVVPEGPIPPPVVPPDGDLFDAFVAADAGQLVDNYVSGAIVVLVLKRGVATLGGASLEKCVIGSTGLYEQAIDGGQVTGPYAPIVQVMLDGRPKLISLCALVGYDVDIQLTQAAAVMCFLDTYPQFWPKLKLRITQLKFESRTADGRGGGVFLDNVIHMSKLYSTPPGAFVRLLVHETGHATFQRTLLSDRPMPNELTTDKVPGMLAYFGKGVPIEKGKLSELGQMCTTIQAYWNAMSAPAKTFYRAWLTLRQNNGRHLVGLDLWQDPSPKRNRLSPDQRRTYQAGKFDEFCAEVFMQFAMGDLYPCVLAAGTMGAEVALAWRNVWHVLVVVASPILGPRHNV